MEDYAYGDIHNIDEYQKMCDRTCGNTVISGDLDLGLIMSALGVSGESGEYADEVKKYFFLKHSLNKEHLIEELGDTLWYICLGATKLGVKMSDIMQKNVDKLRTRYPKGFDPDRSINREEYTPPSSYERYIGHAG